MIALIFSYSPEKGAEGKKAKKRGYDTRDKNVEEGIEKEKGK